MAPPHHALNDLLSPAPLPLRRELVRKALHLSAVAIPLAYHAGAPRSALAALLTVAAGLALAVEGLRRASATLGSAFDRAFGWLSRERERRSLTGATWLALACLGAVVLFSRNAAVAAMWCVAVGDPAAAITGRLWSASRPTGKPSTGRKTVAGSIGCALASFAGVWLLCGYSPGGAMIVAAAAAAAEAASWRFDDNVAMTVAAGVAAQLLA